MLLRCTTSFETSEDGFSFTIDEGTVWYKTRHDVAMGGYELVVIEGVEDGAFTGVMATVRLDRMMDCFDPIPSDEYAPIGVSMFYDQS